MVLTPGAVVQNQGSGGENLPIFSVSGGRMRNQQFSLDGGNVTNVVALAVPQQQVSLPMEAMQEFRVITNNYSAEHGHSTGGVITLSTRSGSNQLHGSLFEYARNEAFDARNFFAATRPKFRQHQYGGSLGGAIIKNKTHFFTSYERTQQVTGATAVQTVPTAAQRAGDFSTTRDSAGRVAPIYDPATNPRQPFPGNVIPPNRIDPVARNITPYWPAPNQAGSATGANNFSLNTRPRFDRDIGIVRADHQFRQQDQLMVRYFVNDNRTTNPGIYPDPVSDASASSTTGRTQSVLGSWTHMFGPEILNDLRAGFVRRRFDQARDGLNEDLPGKLELKGVQPTAFPITAITGFQTLSGGPFRYSIPLLDYQIIDSVSWFRNRHALKVGVETRIGIFNDVQDTSSSGNFAFVAQNTGLPGMANTGNAFASFLLGEANSASLVVSDPIKSTAGYLAWYVQDDWRATDNLTLNFGLRWETEIPRQVDGDRMNAFDTQAINPVSGTPGVVTFAGRNGVPRRAYDTDWNNFGPRIGLAWKVRGVESTVLRAGGGIFYGTTISTVVGTAAGLGFSTDVRLTSPEVGITPAMRLREGFPPYTRPDIETAGAGFGAVPVGQTPTTAVTFFERSRPTPYSMQYNVNLQHELRPNLLVEASYVGNQSRHLTAADLSINQVPYSLAGPGNAQVRRPFPQFSNVSVINPPIGSSSYHAGTLRVEQRFSSGLTFLGHYTFSNFLDDVESFTELGNTGNYMDFYNRKLDRGLSGSDLRHRALVSGVYDLPALRGNRWLGLLAGGWRLGGIATFQSGPPITIFSSVNQTNVFPAGTLRADLIGDPKLSSSERSIDGWFNTAAFRIPDPFRFGTAGRSILRAPGVVNLDASLIKRFVVTERWTTELRGEFFNAVNHTNFGAPGNMAGTPAFGTIRMANPGRSIQLAARLEF